MRDIMELFTTHLIFSNKYLNILRVQSHTVYSQDDPITQNTLLHMVLIHMVNIETLKNQATLTHANLNFLFML